MNHNNTLDYAPDSDTDTSKLLRPAIEEEYKALAIDLIDQAVENKLYWLAESGFTNAKDCNPQQDLDGWNGGGYWEFVYTSIASNIDSHNIVFVPKETQAEKRVHDTIDKLDASGFFNEDKY